MGCDAGGRFPERQSLCLDDLPIVLTNPCTRPPIAGVQGLSTAYSQASQLFGTGAAQQLRDTYETGLARHGDLMKHQGIRPRLASLLLFSNTQTGHLDPIPVVYALAHLLYADAERRWRAIVSTQVDHVLEVARKLNGDRGNHGQDDPRLAIPGPGSLYVNRIDNDLVPPLLFLLQVATIALALCSQGRRARSAEDLVDQLAHALLS